MTQTNENKPRWSKKKHDPNKRKVYRRKQKCSCGSGETFEQCCWFIKRK